MSDVECPYCGADQEICHDDGYGYEEDRTHEQECWECEQSFAYTTGIILVHHAYKADCLNGAPCQYKPTATFPVELTKMECADCGGRRECTDDELRQVLEDATPKPEEL